MKLLILLISVLYSVLLLSQETKYGSAYFGYNTAENDDYGHFRSIPKPFGSGEFTFEIWVKPDTSFPIGDTNNGRNFYWSNADYEPHSSGWWWYDGNFLIDAHPNGGSGNGLFSFQIYAGGRVRWHYNDGGTYTVLQAPWPTQPSVKSILDGNWHKISTVRRWYLLTQSIIELWVDSTMINSDTINSRGNFQTYWSQFDGVRHNWFLAAEKLSATNVAGQWDDFKGNIDNILFWNKAKSPDELKNEYNRDVICNQTDLFGWFKFEESDSIFYNELNSKDSIVVYRQRNDLHKLEAAPLINNCTYLLSVVNGNGDGSYQAGSQVNIIAQDTLNGKIFDKWIGDIQYIYNVNSPIAIVNMPSLDIELIASYKEIITDIPLQISQINVYPNPAKDFLFIDFTNFVVINVEIISPSGMLVYKDVLFSEKNVISIASLSNGIYVLLVYINNEIITHKFIKE